MKQGYKRQQSFEKGIIENWQQDSFPLAGTNSVLYLENYNPNLEHLSLIKRYGENIITYKEQEVKFQSSSFSANVFTYPENREIILANELMLTSNPEYNKTFITFLKRLPNDVSVPNRDGLTDLTLLALLPECTGIVARVYENDGVSDTIGWHEPHIDEADYPGWYTVGLYTDHTRFGEQLLFTTLLDSLPYGTDLDDYMFPAYIWGLWDLTKKRKDGKVWWNGIDFTDLEDEQRYRKWKVKTPTMELLTNDVVGKAWYNKDTNSWDRDGDEKPIEILFMENDLDVTIVDTSEVSPWSEDMGVPGEIDSGIDDKYSYLSKSNTDDYPKLTDTIYYGDDNGNVFFESYHVSEFKEYKEAFETDDYEVVKTSFNEFEWKEIFDNGTLVVDAPEGVGVIHNNITLALIKMPDFLNKADVTINSLTDIEAQSQSCRWAVRNLYLRYIDNNVPRPWHKEEKIPFVLTIKINGVETVLYQDVYTIQTQQGITTPTPDEYLDRIDEGNTNSIKDGYVTTIKNEGEIEGETIKTSFGVASTNDNYACPHVRIEDIDGDKVTLTINNTLQFSIRINKEYFGKLLEQDPTEFNLYVSERNETESYLNTVGILDPIEAPNGYYMKPAIDNVDINDVDFDYAKFRLVKSFLVDGSSQTIDYGLYTGTATRTNAWLEANDDGNTGGDDYVYAVPNVEDGTGFIENNVMPDFDNTYAERELPYGDGSNNDKMWYPDFTLWDYPNDAPPLTLNNSGEYWKGLGAKHIEIIRGRTFIAGTVDDEGKEEQSVVRYSVVQDGAISKDVFVKEDEITFGHSPITALLNYRDQLWVFNEYGQYRMIPHNVADVSSWEVVDVQHAQGCLSNKTLTITPKGVCFASRNGIWISDGRMPSSLTDNPSMGLAIQSLYQRLALGKNYEYQSQADPGRPYTEVENDINPYLELYYEKDNDELVLTTPVRKNDDEMFSNEANNYLIDDWEHMTHELRLIYNFSNNNWRVETFILETDKPTSPGSIRTKTYSKRGRFHLADSKFAVVREQYDVPTENSLGRNSEYENSFVTFNEKNKEITYDTIDIDGIVRVKKIVGRIVTHEIGDGENDFVLRKAYLENSPRDKEDLDNNIYGYRSHIYEGAKADIIANVAPTVNEDDTNGYEVYDTWHDTSNDDYYVCFSNDTGAADWQRVLPTRDPYFLYELRARSWNDQEDKFDYNDIIKLNMDTKKGQNPWKSLMQTPGNTNHGPSDKVVGRESLVGLFPRNTKFRRARFRLVSEMVVKIRSVLIEFSKFKRRSR